jgi:hypothetical protein
MKFVINSITGGKCKLNEKKYNVQMGGLNECPAYDIDDCSYNKINHKHNMLMLHPDKNRNCEKLATLKFKAFNQRKQNYGLCPGSKMSRLKIGSTTFVGVVESYNESDQTLNVRLDHSNEIIIADIDDVEQIWDDNYTENNEHETTEHKTDEHKTDEHKTTEHKTTEHKTDEHETAEHETTEHERNIETVFIDDENAIIILTIYINNIFTYLESNGKFTIFEYVHHYIEKLSKDTIWTDNYGTFNSSNANKLIIFLLISIYIMFNYDNESINKILEKKQLRQYNKSFVYIFRKQLDNAIDTNYDIEDDEDEIDYNDVDSYIYANVIIDRLLSVPN